FEYSEVRARRIKQQVSASGNINPVNIISVGAQVSGIVAKIHVDYNDVVEVGQLLAVIDKSVLAEEVNSTQARMTQAKARYDLASLNRDRTVQLFENGYVAKIELDQAETELASARSDYISANSNYERAKINLNYAEIRSPVNGVVISKSVEEGQTIASSFNAPTLFTIAEDLKKMQIEASVSEADIGDIRKGQSADFTVDAFPTRMFRGTVDQIRLNPKTEQNVVIYNVIIRIDNKDGTLLPGMTAFVEINTQEKDGALSLENTTLQFRPDASIQPLMSYPEGSGRLQAGEGYVYRFDPSAGKISALRIRKGITDGTFTEIISDGIKEGDRFISEYDAAGKKKSANGSSNGRIASSVRPGGRRRGPI
ncbi:MAG: efflux RND transporter periplasmic adaptor subunit, partial [Rickettsiales bacterium]|nr:efflux RND transporter periplasmic adaptor subunit [Rickettsiales bacterium]